MLSKLRMFSTLGGLLLSMMATPSRGATVQDCRQDYLQSYGVCVHAPLYIGYQRYRDKGVDVHWMNYSELEGGTVNSTEVPTITLYINNQEKGKKRGSDSPIAVDGLQPGITYSVSLCATYPVFDPLAAYCSTSTVNIPKTSSPGTDPTVPEPGTPPTPKPKPPVLVYEIPDSPKVLAVESVGNTGNVRLKLQCGKNNSIVQTSFSYKDEGIGNGDDFYFSTRFDKGSCPVNTQQEFVVPFASKPAGNWSYKVWAINGDKVSKGFDDVLGDFQLLEHGLVNPKLPVAVVGSKSVIREVPYTVANYDQIGFGVIYAASQASDCESGDAFHTVYKACMRMNLPDSYWQNFTPNFVISQTINIFQIDKSTANAGVYYGAIGSACPYGGTRKGNRCQVASFSHVVLDIVINPSHNFNINDDQRWPGMFSDKIEGVCPYGGVTTPEESGCTITRLPDLRPGPHYWIDSSPSYKGIYYNSDDRNCYLGGVYFGSGCRLYEFIGAFEKPGRGFYNLPNVEFELFMWGQDLALSYRTTTNNKVCYYGKGEKVGNRCVIRTFPEVKASAWIDRNPSWPGVYYKAVNNQCIYGGAYGGGNCLIFGFTQPVPGQTVEPAPPTAPDEECGKPGVCRRN